MPFHKIDGINFYYEIHGEGEPVVFGNGIFSNTQGWLHQLPAFSKEFQIILYDMRGQGQSDKPPDPYSFDIHADDQKILLEELGFSKVHHVGISYGGELGLVFALKYPEMLKSLVVCAASTFVGPLLKQMCELWRYACVQADPELFYYSTLPLNFGESFLREQIEVLKQAKIRYRGLDYPALVRLLDAFLQIDITEELPKIKIPTCVIAGENDILKSANPYGNLIHEKMPNSELHIIPDSGHVVTFEQPEEFNKIVLRFLNERTQ